MGAAAAADAAGWCGIGGRGALAQGPTRRANATGAPQAEQQPTAGAAFPQFQRNPLWKQLDTVRAGKVNDVRDEIWTTSVSIQGAHLVLDDLAQVFGVDPARD